jgi:hypothetical protein
MATQSSLADLEYASKGYLTRRDWLLCATSMHGSYRVRRCLPRSSPSTPKGEGPGPEPMSLAKMLRMVIAQQQCWDCPTQGPDDPQVHIGKCYVYHGALLDEEP